MKKFIFLFISTCILVPSYGQFQFGHGTDKFEYGKSVRTLKLEDAYIIGGQTNYYSANTNFDATLLKTTVDGDIIWSKVYGLDKWEIFNSVRPVHQEYGKGYVCLGTTNSMGFGGNDMLYVLTDPFGVPLSAYTYGGEKEDNGQCIQVIKDPETNRLANIMIGSTRSYTGDDSKMFIVKTQLNGKYLDAVFVGFEGNQYGHWIEQTDDGGFIAVGSNDFACELKPGSNHDIFVVKLNFKLDVEWARTIGGGANRAKFDAAYSVKEIEEGYIITGITQSFGVRNTNDAFLLKLDDNGNILWLRNYGYVGADGGLDVLPSNSTSYRPMYYLNGYTSINGTIYALLLATSSNGNVVWNMGYGMDGLEIGFEMDRSLNNGFVFTGYENSFGAGSGDIYQVVTDNFGNSNCYQCEVKPNIVSKKHVPCYYEDVFYKHVRTGERTWIEYWDIDYKKSPCDTINSTTKGAESEISIIDKDINWNELIINPNQVTNPEEAMRPDNLVQDGLILFPNPATELVRVKYHDTYQFGNLKVYNNTGQLIISKKLIDPNSTEIPVKKLDNGIYFVSIVSESGESEHRNLLISK